MEITYFERFFNLRNKRLWKIIQEQILDRLLKPILNSIFWKEKQLLRTYVIIDCFSFIVICDGTLRAKLFFAWKKIFNFVC